MSKQNQALALIKSLPGPATWNMLIKFVIVHSGKYDTFVRQCLNNADKMRNPSNVALGNAGRRQPDMKSWECKAIQACKSGQEPGLELARLSEHKSALAQVLDWKRYARLSHLLITLMYLFGLFKYILIDLISHDLSAANKFHFFDCFILGRFRFVGRTNKISSEIACVFLFVFLVYRWTIYLLAPEFKFFALEFLLDSHNEVLRNEALTREAGQQMENGHLGNGKHDDQAVHSFVSSQQALDERLQARLPGLEQEVNRFELPERFKVKKMEGEQKRRRRRRRREGESTGARAGHNLIFYLQSPFDLSGRTWILRPNRTSKSWISLNLCTKALFYGALSYSIAWFAIIYWAIAGSLLSNFGFELSYPACVAWLRNVQQQASAAAAAASNNKTNKFQSDYSRSIYLAPKMLAHEIRIDKLPARISLDYALYSEQQQVNLYNLIRISLDIVENLLIYLELILQFASSLCLLVIHSADVFINATIIRARLMRLLVKLETKKKVKLIVNHNYDYDYKLELNYHLSSMQKGNIEELWELRAEITELQAILADHFGNITLGYNLFVSFFISFLALLQFLYTLTCVTWIISVKSRAVELEFVLAEITVSLMCLSLLCGVAIVRSQNVKLYPLIVRAMALDSDWLVTKPQWISIVQYFFPKSHFCFTFFGGHEISWLLNLKIVFWNLSAFIVLANFYYMNLI